MRMALRSVPVIAAACLVFSAGAVQAQEDVTFEKKDPLKIGYSVFDMMQPYWQEYARGIQEASEAAGAEFLLSDQKSSQEAMVSGSLDLINQGISALVVSPVQPSALPTVVDAAHDANIPVIVGDVGAEGDYDAFILSDNYEGGVMAAQYMVEALADLPEPREVLMILLHPGSAVGWVRAAGFRDEMANHDGYVIVAELNGADTVEGGFTVTRDALAANPDLVGIYGSNDPEAIGAVQALAEAGKEGVTVVGFNADPPALELIKSGDIAATIRQDPYGQGKAAVEAALTLLDGQPLAYSDEETRTLYFPVDVVTAENVDMYLAPAE